MAQRSTPITVGSEWESTNPGHPPSRYRVLAVTSRCVKVLNVTRRGSRQHKHKTYMIPLPNFRAHHRQTRQEGGQGAA